MVCPSLNVIKKQNLTVEHYCQSMAVIWQKCWGWRLLQTSAALAHVLPLQIKKEKADFFKTLYATCRKSLQ